MNKKVNPKPLGVVATALDHNISAEDMDHLLAERQEEVNALLGEARAAIDRGEVAPLEPLHEFLRRARKRLEASR